jgi:preprotein translocase SecE subunit
MSLELYKTGQGRYARWAAYLLAGLLILYGAIRLYATINVPGQNVWVEELPIVGTLSLYKVIAAVVFFMGMYALHMLLNRPTSVDMLIDTEQEMKKVSWPTKAEVKSATVVVAFVTFLLALLLFGFDEILRRLFRLVF